MAQKTLAPELIVEDKKVGMAIGAIGVSITLFMIAVVVGLTMYDAAFYAVAR